MRRRFEKPGFNYSSGHMVEHEAFGEVKETLRRERSYMPYRQSIETVKNHQPWDDPTDPEPRFANDLHATVFDDLGLNAEDVRFYTAVGSSLDHHHGVDAFFEIGVDKQVDIVTLDVTMNELKGEDAKADVTFHMPSEGLDPKLDKERYLELVKEVSSRVGEALSYKQKREEAS